MNNVDLQYYKTNVNYNKWVKDIVGSKSLNNKQDFDAINRKTLNKDFIYIYAFFEWMYKKDTVTYYQENGNNAKFKPESTKTSFLEIDLFPYKNDVNDIIPIINVTDYIKMISVEKNSKAIQKLEQVYTELPQKLADYEGKSRLGFYIDKNHANFDSANDGLYFQLLSSIDKNPNDYIANEKSSKKQFEIVKKKLENLILNFFKYYEIVIKTNIADTEDGLISRYGKINDLARMIKGVIQSILSMIEGLYNNLSSDTEDNIKIDDLGDTIASSNTDSVADIESIMMRAKPGIRPLFKKSYVVRENNLKPYVTVTMAYFSKKDRETIPIRNFDIPYNNITSFEHNVKEHAITLSIIDTEGVISELLIQKMYAVSQNKANVRKSSIDGDPTMPYHFLIEYGWSGPESDDEDELLEEGVFTKCVNRGFITSISSQFTPKGNEYTLTIKPNDHESINKYLNNTDMFYFNDTNEELSTVTGMFALFLILWSGDLYTNNEQTKDFENLFSTIEKARIYKSGTKYWIDINNKGQNGPYSNNQTRAHSGYILTHISSFPLNTQESKEIENVLTKMWGDAADLENPPTFYELKSISFTKTLRLDNLKKAADAGDFVMNGWIAAIYMLWKMKRYFKNVEEFIIADTTGLFDVFDEKDKISMDKIKYVIKKFNPLAHSSPRELSNFALIINSLSGDMKNKKSKNMFELKNILDFKEFGKGQTKTTKLTLFTNQIASVFKSIQDLGLNSNLDANSKELICQASSSIDSDFMKYDLRYNKLEDVKKEYRRRLFTDKFNLIDNATESQNKTDAPLVDYFLNKFFKNIDKEIENKENELKSAENDAFIFGYEFSITEGFGANIVDSAKERLEKAKKDLDTKKICILYLSYMVDANKISYLNTSIKRKISLFSRNVAQSYSFMPRIKPKTRSPNRQFFTQGNRQILREGTGDIIEFSMDPIDIGNFSSLMISNKNKNNIILDNLKSNTHLGGIYENAAKYYRQYKDIDGDVNPQSIARDLAKLDLNYQTQMNLKGSITIIGEPYWSGINSVMKYIFINVYYTNGQRSSFTGLYYVTNIIQSISDGKFTTKIEITRALTFLSNLEQIGKKNVVLS